jgi:hypothetical protein
MWSGPIGSSDFSNRERTAGQITCPEDASRPEEMEPTAPDAEPVQHGRISDIQIKVTFHGSLFLG